jgi:hypothetical protein
VLQGEGKAVVVAVQGSAKLQPGSLPKSPTEHPHNKNKVQAFICTFRARRSYLKNLEMLDPFSALGVVSNIVALLDVGRQVVSQIHNYLHYSGDALPSNESLT